MARHRTLVALGLFLSLTLTVAAQEADSTPLLTAPPTTHAPAVPYLPRATVQPGGMPVMPPPPGYAPSLPQFPLAPPAPLGLVPATPVPQRPRTNSGEHYAVPAKVEFHDGTTLV